MIVHLFLILLGIVVIIWLLKQIIRRSRQISERTIEVRKELEQNPQAPYAALAELLQDRRNK